MTIISPVGWAKFRPMNFELALNYHGILPTISQNRRQLVGKMPINTVPKSNAGAAFRPPYIFAV